MFPLSNLGNGWQQIKLKTIQTIRFYSQAFLAYITSTVSTYSSVYTAEILLLKTEPFRNLHSSLALGPLSEAGHTSIDLIRITEDQGASEQVTNAKGC